MTSINIIRASLKEVAKELSRYGEVFIVYDRNVAHIVGKLQLNPRAMMALDATETDKTFRTAAGICGWLMDEGADRDAFVLGVGGGITTDITGFAASIYKRGVKFGFLPTTLLSQVDAAIGGKNGVNLDSYKNMMGVIRQPEMTFICHEVLESLPFGQIVSGAAELFKTFIIDDSQNLYEEAVETFASIRDSYRMTGEVKLPAGIQNEISAAAEIKAGIAGRDPMEHGERRLLNLGHTFAHAIEKKSQAEAEMTGGRRIGHGEAVGIGIVMAAKVSEAMGLAEKGLADRIKADFERAGMETSCPFAPKDLVEAMKKDKKAEGEIIHFVLPSEIGKVMICDLDAATAAKALEQ